MIFMRKTNENKKRDKLEHEIITGEYMTKSELLKYKAAKIKITQKEREKLEFNVNAPILFVLAGIIVAVVLAYCLKSLFEKRDGFGAVGKKEETTEEVARDL